MSAALHGTVRSDVRGKVHGKVRGNTRAYVRGNVCHCLRRCAQSTRANLSWRIQGQQTQVTRA